SRGRPAPVAGDQLQCHTHQEDDHRQRPSAQGPGAAHDPARARSARAAGTARRGRRLGRGAVPLLRAATADVKVLMITKVSGVVNRVLEEEVRLQIGPLEYQVLVPDFVRRQIQQRVGQELTLYTSQYFEGNPMQGRVVPRMIGFLTEAEMVFFELF